MKSEQEIQNDIRQALSINDCIVFRANVGKVRMADGRFFDTGLPKGHPDLYGFKKSNGKVFYIEVKNKNGKLRKEQISFHKALSKYNIIHGVARSSEDAVKIVREELCGYGY